MATLPELLQTLVEVNGSDLHLTTQTQPQPAFHHQHSFCTPLLPLHGMLFRYLAPGK